MVQETTAFLKQNSEGSSFGVSILLRLLRRFNLMPNRARGSDLWSEIIQVSVTPEVKEQIRQIARETDTSQSNVVRELLNQALGKEPFATD